MYVWTVKLEEKWDYEKDYNGGDDEYTVAAKNYEQALEKAKKASLKKSFLDELPEGDGKVHRVKEVRLIQIERGAELDA